MDHLQRVLILLLVAGIPAAAPPFLASAPHLCFTAGAITYELAAGASAADLRVKPDLGVKPDLRVKVVAPDANPDLRIHLVNDVQSADFAIVDDYAGPPAYACVSSGSVTRVRVVRDTEPADVSIGFSSEPSIDDWKLFVHSARFGHRDAAALFAAMRHDAEIVQFQTASPLIPGEPLGLH